LTTLQAKSSQISSIPYSSILPLSIFFEFGQKKPVTVAMGGLGIPLIRGLCKTLRYAWCDGRNNTEMEF